jgi:hypothetical protein
MSMTERTYPQSKCHPTKYTPTRTSKLKVLIWQGVNGELDFLFYNAKENTYAYIFYATTVNNTQRKSIISCDYKESKDMNEKNFVSRQIIIPL